MNLKNIIEQKKPDKREYTLNKSMYVKFKNKKN